MIPRRRVVYWLIGMLVLLLAACGTPAAQPPASDATSTPAAETPDTDTPTDTETPADSRDLPPEAVLDAQSWLAEQRGVPVEQVEIVETEQRQWPDSCLGLGRANESCAAVITPGWRVVFEVDGQEVEVRTDETGETIRLATPAESRGGDNELAGTVWTLVSFGPEGDHTPVIEGSTVTLSFSDGRAEGDGGCNSYGGTYQVQGNTISFSDVERTLMACVDERVTEQEQDYFRALETAGTFELQNNRLLITYNNGQSVLTFESAFDA